MDEYKPNSHLAKERAKMTEQPALPEKKTEKIITGNVKARKKSELHKLANVFMAEDVESVKSYIVMDVLVPALKKAISDVITNGIDMLLYGEYRGHKKDSAASKVSYRSFYERENDRRESRYAKTRAGYNYDDVILDNRNEAADVLSRMDELISTYGLVSVADFYDLVGITGNYTDNKYGWTDIRSADVIRVRNGYMIKLPKALPLN